MGEEVNQDPTARAFQEPKIVREIFQYFPTSTLLSTCSLVNRNWSRQVRSFIRDNRECTVKLGYEGDLWQRFLELEELLRESVDIPFNSLRVVITDDNFQCPEKADMKDLANLLTRFPIKFLSIFEEGGTELVTGPAAETVLELVRLNSSTLEELEIRSDSENVGLFKDWEPPEKFENLEKLSIAEASSVSPACANQIILRAPKLKAIHNNCLHMLRNIVIPEDIYRHLKRLAFALEDIQLVENFADKLNGLAELIVKQEEGWLRSNLEGNGAASKRRFIFLCHRLLGLNARKLRSLAIRCEDDDLFLELLLPFPFDSVENLYLSVNNVSMCLVQMMSINFPRHSPNLRQVLIREEDLPELFDESVILAGDIGVNLNASQSTLELFIDGSICFDDFYKLRRLFPNVIKLSIKSVSIVPLRFIPRLWPRLQRLSITTGSLDGVGLAANVLGFRSTQLEFLREQADLQLMSYKDFLKRAAGRLRRPCVATLKELEHFQVEYLRLVGAEMTRTFLDAVEFFLRRDTDLTVRIRPHLLTVSSWSTPRFGDLYEDLCDPALTLFLPIQDQDGHDPLP